MEHPSNNRFVRKDLAARNCLVSAQGQVKAILEGDFSTKSDDVWAFRVLMWEVFIHGEMPHGGKADDEVLADLQAGKARLPQPEGCPSKLYRLM
ncbi:Inactive tyrosine-protein kinase 7 [Camelus dromedarius]|uniref:Inactive tyrosine-protein kinase 7 n=1 Tax=Camelus dromedarius TaxID=9838 RepID=A0A5N4C572_CAMDR|nr:Inactive tyrosine-protein kinase 7 [Camelus dromedarius]